MLSSLATSMKDGALSMSLKALVNDKFGMYGEILDCAVDTRNNKLVLEARLKGESQELIATIERYEIQRDGDDRYIVLLNFSSSREWLDVLLNKLLAGKRYKLPAMVTMLL